MLAFFGMPGIFEILILLFLAAVPLGAIIAVVVATKRSAANLADNPNLEPCPDCGRYISVRASTCPHCASPIKGG
jgi:hypothetical protein